jgi:hypothetical protein
MGKKRRQVLGVTDLQPPIQNSRFQNGRGTPGFWLLAPCSWLLPFKNAGASGYMYEKKGAVTPAHEEELGARRNSMPSTGFSMTQWFDDPITQ